MKNKTKVFLSLSFPDVMRSTMLGTLVAICNDIFRLPLRIPGHTSLYWMGILVLGKGLIPRFGSGILMGIISGVLAVLLGLGKEGVFVFFKYFTPGLMLDVLAFLFMNRFDKVSVCVVTGTLISLAKLLANIALGVVLKMPLVFLTLGIGYSAVTHTVFGALGGFLAAILIKRLKPRLTSWD